MKDNSSIYSRQPLGRIGDIARYSEFNRYVLNYMAIAHEHVEELRRGAVNPFMPDQLSFDLHRTTQEVIERFIKPGDFILDVGVGLGELIAPLKNCNLFGVDLSIDYLQIAKSKGIDVIMCLAEELPYHDSVFDMVVATDVLEHVLDLNAVTRTITRVIKPGGYLVVRVPLEEDLSPYLSQDIPYEYVHLRSFSESEIRLHFEKCCGFEYVETSFSVPYLQGHSRFKGRFLLEKDRALLASLSQISEVSSILALLQTVSLEELQNEIYRIQRDYPDLYGLLEKLIIKPIDFNCTFRKL